MKKYLVTLITFVFISLSLAQIPVPVQGCYHAAFTGNDSHAQFVSLAKKEIAIEMFFTGWPNNKFPDFPKTKCDEIAGNGSIPHITWMIYTSGTTYPLDAILNGSYDNYVSGYADQVKEWGKPLFIRLGHEFNGDWYPYGGAKNGGGTTNGFGDPAKADGPERFIAAYKRVVDLFRAKGITNVTWIWCPNNGSAPNEPWNAPENYYPGNDYVDWIGLDGYNFGKTQTWSGWADLWHVYANESGTGVYQKFSKYDKPMMIAEFASVEQGGNKADWITAGYGITLKYSFTKIKAVTWFHIRKSENGVDTDWRINSSGSALTAYQNAIADPYFLSSIITDIKNEELPAEFILAQNYPNPFNPSTTIQYNIPVVNTMSAGSASAASRAAEVHVLLKVYDVLGHEVATLVDEIKAPGKYEVKFDSRFASTKLQGGLGRTFGLTSGIYFYTLTTGNKSISRKMLLLK